MTASNEFVPGENLAWMDEDTAELLSGSSRSAGANARAAIVNRTHRVVRERAEKMQARRSNARGLVVPLAICSVLLLMLSYAAWTVFSGSALGFGTVGSELEEQASKLLSMPAIDTDGPGSVLFLWFLPISAVALGTVMFRRSRDRRNDEVGR